MKVIKWIICIIVAITIIPISVGGIYLFGASKFLTLDGIKEVVENIDIKDALKDEEGKVTEIGEKVYDTLENFGINNEQADKLLESKEIKEIISEFASGLIMHQLDSNIEIAIPSQEKIEEVVKNNLDSVGNALGIDTSKIKDVDKEVKEAVSQNYDKIVDYFNQLKKQIGE